MKECLHFCRRGRPEYLASFLRHVQKKQNLNWVHGFHRVLEAFSEFCLWKCVFAFVRGGRPSVLSKFPPKSQTNKIWIGYMDFIGFWRLCFGILLMTLFFAFVQGGKAQGTQQVSSEKSKNKTNLNWIHGFHKVLDAVSGFCWWGCFLYFCSGDAQGT